MANYRTDPTASGGAPEASVGMQNKKNGRPIGLPFAIHLNRSAYKSSVVYLNRFGLRASHSTTTGLATKTEL